MGFLLKFSIFLLHIQVSIVSVVSDSIINSPRVTNWGTWGSWQYCPPSTYVVGFQLKVEQPIGKGDDTALNGIKLFCNTSPNADSNYDYQISSSVGPWGNWQGVMRCGKGFVTGFKIRQEASCGKCDDTAANNFQVFCKSEGWKIGDGTIWGFWSSDINCQGAEKICGIRTQVEQPQGKGDDTSLNNVDFKCCR